MEENKIEFTDEDELEAGEIAAVKPYGVAADIYSWIDTLIGSFLIIIILFTFFIRTSTVDGESMLPTLEDKQMLLVTDFLYQPTYNDIVVVWADDIPNDEDGYGKAIVKRVIGLPGDNIRFDFANGYVYRNGELLQLQVNDGVLYEDGHMLNSYTNLSEGRGDEFNVPEGKIFVMGDNRNGSTDSRSRMVGDVDMRKIVGKALFRLFPFDKIGGLY
ncbi:MAG: signal peptidase I [Ruminiclostridium sp.]|nr:signal peptidase I [Ruminiclostridium sp.]